MAVGDAYGVGFEFRSQGFVLKHNLLQAYYPHERYASLYKKYSDDTQLSIAIAEFMLTSIEWTSNNLATAFVKTFQRDIRPGYSSRMYNALVAQ